MYHLTKKFAWIDPYSANIMNDDFFVRYICNDFMLYIQNVDQVLREVQMNVDKNKHILMDYKHEFVSSLQKNGNNLTIGSNRM